MDPTIWGTGAWTFLHSVALNYPLKPGYMDKKRYSEFFHNLQFVLPCPDCQQHYIRNLKKHPIQVGSRDGLVAWLVTIHNEVNRENGKNLWSMDEFYSHYRDMYSDRNSDYSEYIPYLVILVILLFMIYYWRKNINPPS